MPAMIRTDHPRQLQEGLNTVFGLNYKRWTPEWKGVYEEENSNKAYEEETLNVGFGTAPEKDEGDGVAYDAGQEAWTARYQHITVALAFAISEEALEDNLYGDLGSRYAKALARSVQETKEIYAAATFNNAGDANFLGGDGVALSSTSHPTTHVGNFSNKLSTASELSETSMEDMVIRIGAIVDDRGIPVQCAMKKMVVPNALRFVAKRIYDNDMRPGTADRDINALKASGDLKGGFHIMRRITTAAAWFAITDIDDGLKHFVRKRLSRKMEGDFDTGNVKYKVRERYSFGWTDPRCVYSSGHL
jgi:hypothetical protein